MCAYHCSRLSRTIQHRTVLMLFPLIPWTIITAQMSTGVETVEGIIKNMTC